MSEGIDTANPAAFGARGLLALVLFGVLAFVAALYGLSAATGGNANDGNAHAGGKGLNGFAGLVALLEADGFDVATVRDPSALAQPGVLVLTPPANVDTSALGRIVDARRRIGPTIIIHPKWLALRSQAPAARRGWVTLPATRLAEWPRFHDEIVLDETAPKGRPAGGWHAAGRSGRLPDDHRVASGAGRGLVPLVTAGDGRMLAGFEGDQGRYPDLARLAGVPDTIGGADTDLKPLVFVFEPDLLDNWGLADERTALLARELVLASGGGRKVPVRFDLTLSGYGHSRSLIDLAFRPPYLAATLCLLLAALATGWRAFLRFGPAHVRGREIALGKTALVDNSAGLIRRARRLRLVAAPFAALVRERIAAALRLPRGLYPAQVEAAIDAAARRRDPALPAFTQTADALRTARNSHDLARHARTLQTIEKALT